MDEMRFKRCVKSRVRKGDFVVDPSDEVGGLGKQIKADLAVRSERTGENVKRTQMGVVNDVLGGLDLAGMVKKYRLPESVCVMLREMAIHVCRQNEMLQTIIHVRDSELLERAMFCNMAQGIMSEDKAEQFRWQSHYSRIFPLEYKDGLRRQMRVAEIRGRDGEEVQVVGEIDSRIFRAQAEIEQFDKDVQMQQQLETDGV